MTPYISPSAGDATERFVINGIAFRRMTEAEIAILPPRKRRPPTVNRVDAESFLSALDPTATKFTFQVFPDGAGCKVAKKGRIEQGSVGKLWAILADFNRRGAGVFVTINETDFKGRKKENIKRIRALFIDLDGTPLPAEDAFHVKPHIIVESSPGKWHVYWLVKIEPAPLLDESDPRYKQLKQAEPNEDPNALHNRLARVFTPLQKRLIRHYGGDKSVHDLPRVLRLPGFVHQKGEPFVTRLVQAHDHDHYAVEDFVRGLPAQDNKKSSDEGNGADREESSDWGELYTDIITGRSLYPALRDLALKYVFAGMTPGAIVNTLYALMDQSQAHHGDHARWTDRRARIPEIVDGAVEKHAELTAPEPEPAPAPRSLEQVHAVFRRWLGPDFDTVALDVVLATAAVEQLTGDPVWLLVVAPPGGAKTETVCALEGAGAWVTSTIQSEGALLSAVKPRGKAAQARATGGLLRKIGERGILVIKDVTSILAADRNIRGTVLAALREVYDGKWERNVGSEGGLTIPWNGRIIVIGAVTTAWDTHHSVIAALGDRFVLVRLDSDEDGKRAKAGDQSISNIGDEVQMREEMRDAVGGLLAKITTTIPAFEQKDKTRLVKMANVVTRARTGVERDYRGDVTYAHAPEMPTRLAKQLMQVARGAMAIGMSRDAAMHLAARCAYDSVPPLRMDIIQDLAVPGVGRLSVAAVRRHVGAPWSTVKREMDALVLLHVLQVDEEKAGEGGEKTNWLYSLHPNFDRVTVAGMTLPPGANAGGSKQGEFSWGASPKK